MQKIGIIVQNLAGPRWPGPFPLFCQSSPHIAIVCNCRNVCHILHHVRDNFLLTFFCFASLAAKIGKQHPDRVVETSTLSSVPPPDVTYSLSLPNAIADDGLLSALQLEAITYACQVCCDVVLQLAHE